MSDKIRRAWAIALSVATTALAFALSVEPMMRRW